MVNPHGEVSSAWMPGWDMSLQGFKEVAGSQWGILTIQNQNRFFGTVLTIGLFVNRDNNNCFVPFFFFFPFLLHVLSLCSQVFLFFFFTFSDLSSLLCILFLSFLSFTFFSWKDGDYKATSFHDNFPPPLWNIHCQQASVPNAGVSV